MHTFCLTRVPKKIIHDRLRDGTGGALEQVIRSAGLLGRCSHMIFKSKRVIQKLPGLRPFDLSFCPTPLVWHTNSPPSPFKEFGFDFTITPPNGHLPLSRLRAASSNQPALALKHLVDKERRKLMRDGSGNPYNNNTLAGKEIMAALLWAGTALFPVAISPY